MSYLTKKGTGIKMTKFKEFLKRKDIEISAKRYFIYAMGAMALGLFATLIIGTIVDSVADLIYGAASTDDFLHQISVMCSAATGMAIGVAVANALKAPPLVMFSSAVVGSMGYSLGAVIATGDAPIKYTAGPAGAFIAALVAVELGKVVSKETKVDIIVTPLVTIFSGFGIAALCCPAIAYVMYYLGDFINTATQYQPFIMGIILAVVVGIILTLPISSAAICAMIGISGIAGGAAAVGCCAQMVGFAVISFRENKWGGVVAQGLGTSMLQMGNICKKPAIWIAPILAGAVCGPISTMVFKLTCNGVAAGMGTCGLVGPIGIFSAMGANTASIVGVVLCCIVLPAILSFIFNEILRKIGLVKTGDMVLGL